MMERSAVRNKRSAKGCATKKTTKPLKVVYISNPVRVTTSAATFRGLVQQLTGRDSIVADTAGSATARPAPVFHSAAHVIHAPSPAPSSLVADREGKVGKAFVGGAGALLPFETANFDSRKLEDVSGGWRTPPAVFYDPRDGRSTYEA